MTPQPPVSSDRDDRVVKFVPRRQIRPTPNSAGRPSTAKGSVPRQTSQADDRSGRKPPDDYRHRMIANVAATLFAVILTAVGLWLATSLTHMRQTQDCIASGRRDCGGIFTAPHS